MPIPADPVLLLMGAMAGDGRCSALLAIAAGALACIAGDLIWYELGRRKGARILRVLCKISLEPDNCVRRAEEGFSRRGAWSLVLAKFVPGLSLVSVPVAGALRMRAGTFLLADGAGSLLWCSAYVLAGRIFHRQIDDVIAILGLFGKRAALVVTILLASWVGFRSLQRYLFLRRLRVNRVSPAEAHRLIGEGRGLRVVDLRHPGDIERSGQKIAGALVMAPQDLRSRAHEIPAAQEIILYCT